MSRTKLLLLLALLAGNFFVPANATTGPQAEFRKLADDVYVFIGKLNDANAMAIVTSQGVVVVDTGNNQPETHKLLNSIRSVTSQPIRYVVITQNHGDHIGGVPLFAPPAVVIVHDGVARDLRALKPYQIKSWRKRFPERAETLKDLTPVDMIISFPDRMTLSLGSQRIELIYVDDTYNIGDVAVWLPDSAILHASFAGYKDRHPDIRPDYSHGTTRGMLKQLEVLIALKPRVVVPSHGPLGDVRDLQAMVDYLLIARQKVRAMMENGLPLQTIVRQFEMNEFKGWDRTQHFPWMAETIYRELRGEGPLLNKLVVKELKATIAKIAEEGRYLTVTSDMGEELKLRISSDTNIEGVADRTQLKPGMRFTATYQVPEAGIPALGYDVEEIVIPP